MEYFYGYTPGALYTDNTQGIALFEYDPDCNRKGLADWRLWFEAASERGTKYGQDVYKQ